jgi:hypothetical protein
MKFKTNIIRSIVVSAGLLVSASSAFAQVAAPYTAGDLLAGFTVGSGNDLIVNLGPAGTALVDGNSWNLSALLAGFNSGVLDGTSWGVVGVSNSPNRVLSTCLGTPSSVAALGTFNTVKTSLTSLGADLVGSTGSGTPAASSASSWYNGTVVPNSGSFRAVYDNPNTQASGAATINFFSAVQSSSVSQIGTFTLSAAGVLTFNTNSAVVPVPPPPHIVNITRVGTLSTVFFTTTNGSYTYGLSYTNTAGINTPISTWPTNSTTVIGNGSTLSIPDTTTDSTRIYRVGVH